MAAVMSKLFIVIILMLNVKIRSWMQMEPSVYNSVCFICACFLKAENKNGNEQNRKLLLDLYWGQCSQFLRSGYVL